ncbi:hypothetical protein KAFR_0A03600 [Kazachstania africana CBS 2517]|uniref:Nucleolar protein Dnt1-like N-terminal domain-containing protein n=1 Tax=Kazachstania africana (strain ATCC 22294 / BCRC 22015 / CBS 2517 / CECT 1963 / NBRC 1671 / NRRL Y-8276) TaxID=1071382 RepID=H2AN45_KAZAF|nr:hypothetical protein KAFR_0A03600 [Kazachstania africana CBS 2517]CCF55795.1 hypothetical protein KAFR_0A03600 [Kazachstania africana CBS 2517]
MYKLQVVLVPPSAKDFILPLGFNSNSGMIDPNNTLNQPNNLSNNQEASMNQIFPSNNSSIFNFNNVRFKKFLHFTKPNNNLFALSQEILNKCEKMYPKLIDDIEILSLQDANSCDLDPDFTVKDVFNVDNVVQVILKNELDIDNNEDMSLYRNAKRIKLDSGSSQITQQNYTGGNSGVIKVLKKRTNQANLRVSTPLANQIYPNTNNNSDIDNNDEDFGERSFLPPPTHPQSPPIRISSGIDNYSVKRIKVTNEDTVSRSATVDPDKTKQQRMLSGTPLKNTMTPNRVTLTGQRVVSENNVTSSNNNNGLIFTGVTSSNKSAPNSTPRIASGMLSIPEPKISEVEKELREGPSSPSSLLPAKPDRIPMKKPYIEKTEQPESSSEDFSESSSSEVRDSNASPSKEANGVATELSIKSPTKNTPFNTVSSIQYRDLANHTSVQRKSSLETRIESKAIAQTAQGHNEMRRIDNFSDTDDEENERMDDTSIGNDTVRHNDLDSSKTMHKDDLIRMVTDYQNSKQVAPSPILEKPTLSNSSLDIKDSEEKITQQKKSDIESSLISKPLKENLIEPEKGSLFKSVESSSNSTIRVLRNTKKVPEEQENESELSADDEEDKDKNKPLHKKSYRKPDTPAPSKDHLSTVTSKKSITSEDNKSVDKPQVKSSGENAKPKQSLVTKSKPTKVTKPTIEASPKGKKMIVPILNKHNIVTPKAPNKANDAPPPRISQGTNAKKEQKGEVKGSSSNDSDESSSSSDSSSSDNETERVVTVRTVTKKPSTRASLNKAQAQKVIDKSVKEHFPFKKIQKEKVYQTPEFLESSDESDTNTENGLNQDKKGKKLQEEKVEKGEVINKNSENDEAAPMTKLEKDTHKKEPVKKAVSTKPDVAKSTKDTLQKKEAQKNEPSKAKDNKTAAVSLETHGLVSRNVMAPGLTSNVKNSKSASLSSSDRESSSSRDDSSSYYSSTDDSSSEEENSTSSTRKARRLVVAPPKGIVGTYSRKTTLGNISDLENAPQSTQVSSLSSQQASPSKTLVQSKQLNGATAPSKVQPHDSSSSLSSSSVSNKLPQKIRPSLSSLSDLASRGIPDVREKSNKVASSHQKTKAEKEESESDSESSDDNSSHESSSDDDDDSESDSDSSSDNGNSDFISAKSASALLGKKKKKASGGFASLIKDSKKK